MIELTQTVHTLLDNIYWTLPVVNHKMNCITFSLRKENFCCSFYWFIKINQVKWPSKRSRNFYTAHFIGYQNIYIIHMASYDESSLKAVYKSVELRY